MNDRQHLRIDQNVSIVIDYFQKREGTYQPILLLCESLDVSAGGFKVQVNKALKADAIYSIALKVADKTFQLVAQAKWVKSCVEAGAYDANGYWVGFQLLESDGTDIIAFKQWVAEQYRL